MLMRSAVQLGLVVLLFGLACPEFVFLLFLTEMGHLGSPLPVQSPACLDAAASVLDYLKTGPFMLLRSLAHSDSVLLAFKVARSGAPPPASDSTHPGLLLFVRSIACTGLATPVLDLLRLDSSLSVQSFICCGFSPLALDLLQTEFFPSLQSFLCAGLAMFVSGVACCGSMLLVPDSASLGSVPSLRSLA